MHIFNKWLLSFRSIFISGCVFVAASSQAQLSWISNLLSGSISIFRHFLGDLNAKQPEGRHFKTNTMNFFAVQLFATFFQFTGKCWVTVFFFFFLLNYSSFYYLVILSLFLLFPNGRRLPEWLRLFQLWYTVKLVF